MDRPPVEEVPFMSGQSPASKTAGKKEPAVSVKVNGTLLNYSGLNHNAREHDINTSFFH